MSTPPTRPRPTRITTRVLLVTAAFGALGALVLILVAPFTSALAALFPPAYALAAGVHSILPFLARRLLGFRWAATLVGVFVGLLSIGFTPLGVLIVVPLALSGLGFDVTLRLLGRRRPARETHYLCAGVASAVVLFLVSLPVMSPDDLAPWIVSLTLLGRIAGQLGAVLLSGLIAPRVLRAGILPAGIRPGGGRAAGTAPMRSAPGEAGVKTRQDLDPRG